MKITQEPEPSLLKRILGFLFFFLFSLAALVWWVWELINLYQQVTSNADIINFEKGTLYLFGVSVLGGFLSYAIFHEVILKRPYTESITKWIHKGFSFGLISLILFPYVVRLPLEEYLEKKDYLICEIESYQWSMYRAIVYTSSLEACDEAIEIEKNRIERL
jgi:hypothetical protein